MSTAPLFACFAMAEANKTSTDWVHEGLDSNLKTIEQHIMSFILGYRFYRLSLDDQKDWALVSREAVSTLHQINFDEDDPEALTRLSIRNCRWQYNEFQSDTFYGCDPTDGGLLSQKQLVKLVVRHPTLQHVTAHFAEDTMHFLRAVKPSVTLSNAFCTRSTTQHSLARM